MALDRQDIEKRDFPITRRGYEPEAVDAHLARVAEEVDRLGRGQSAAERPGPASLASAASEQVRAIVEAAETSADAIETQAREDGDRIRSEAEADARRTREDALSQSRKHLGSVQEATQLMLQRVSAMESELGSLIEALRTGANRLNADLSLLDGNLGELYDAAGAARSPGGGVSVREPEPVRAAEPEPVRVAESEPEPEPVRVAEPEPAEEWADEPEAAEPEPPAAAAEGTGPSALTPAAAGPAADAPDADVEGARLVALNMALNGSSREETDRYLADNFDLADRAGLLDEVYSTVEG